MRPWRAQVRSDAEQHFDRESLHAESGPLSKWLKGKLIKLWLSLPISFAALECSFLALPRLKIWLRNTMMQVRLTHLQIMNAHSDILDVIDVPILMKTFY